MECYIKFLIGLKMNLKNLGLRSFFEEHDNEKENELFLVSIYDAVIEESDKEDEIWSKYL